MKLVTGTKIYKDTRQLLDEILDTTVNFPNSFKHTIGSKMQNYTIHALNDIAGAYIKIDLTERINHLSDFQMRLETLRTMIRVAGERKWVSYKKYGQFITLTTRIGKQATAWKNALTKASAQQQAPEGQG